VVGVLAIEISIFWEIKTCSLAKVNKRLERIYFLPHADFLLVLLFNPEDGGNIFLQNIT
jgi:hypothetical protein